MLQIRIADYDGSNPVILENAFGRRFTESVNLSGEGISFEIAKSAPKAEILNPDNGGDTKRWEVWDTETNNRLNFGPIEDVADGDTTWKVTGLGRVGYLADFIRSKKSFYAPIKDLITELTLENIAGQPRTSTIVADSVDSAEQVTVFGNTVVINEKYHGLSKQTKDNVIDEDTGLILPGQIEPPNTYYSSDSFWAGMSKSDSHIIDLGGIYQIKKLVHTFPNWGGNTRRFNRTYDFTIAVATDEGSTTSLQGKEFGTFTTIHTTDTPNRIGYGPTGPLVLYIGDNNGTIEVDTIPLDLPPVDVRYIRTQVTNVHAWLGSYFDNEPANDVWDWQCDSEYVTGSNPATSRPAQMTDPINDRTLEPPNDCYASILEVGSYQEILPVREIQPVALQRIDNNSRQITYYYSPVSTETTTTDNGFRKFEPGSIFRKIHVTYSGASTAHSKFFDDDCDNCYADTFRFGIMDQNNSLVYETNTSSGTNVTIRLPANSSHVMMKGSSDATVTYCDAWPAKLDQASWGGSYSYNEVTNDYAIVHFRGQSFRWYATIPADKTGAQVRVELRHKIDTAAQFARPTTTPYAQRTLPWSNWSTLSTFTLPNNISAEIVYEIPYESGILAEGTIYQIRITNLDGNYCSIDSIEGYWESSMVEYNEDSTRIFVSRPESMKQIYDKRFSNGSMYKYEKDNFTAIDFVGDRIIVLSAKGQNHGKASIALLDRSKGHAYDTGTNKIAIPGGDPDGTLTIDLDTGKSGNEIPQYILFDSNDYFTSGLPWGVYTLGLYLLAGNLETYTSNTADVDFDSFVARCKDCEPTTGDPITVNKPIFLDSIIVHETIGLSISFDNETHLDQLRSIIEAIQCEASVDDDGLVVKPRVGQDTDIMLREGENTLVGKSITNDYSQMATMLVSSGADIDGLPLFTITENKKTRRRLGRTIMRQQDFRSVGSYFQLIGLSRTVLAQRAYPEKRIRVSHIANNLELEKGDSFLLWTKKMGIKRVRIIDREIDETNGRVYNLECVTWPQIV